MFPRTRRHGALLLFKLMEAAQAGTAYAVALAAAHTSASHSVLAVPRDLLLVVVLTLLWHAVLLARGLYASHRLEDGGRETWSAANAAATLAALAAVLAIALLPQRASQGFLLSFWAALTLQVVLGRVLLRDLLAKVHRQGRNLRFALIVGSGERAQRFARLLRERERSGYRVLGCVDEQPPADPQAMRWLGRLDALPQVLSGTVVDEVFIMLPMRSSYAQIQRVVSCCEEQGALVTMPADFFTARLARTRTGSVAAQPVLYLSSVPENDWRFAWKRAIDCTVALILLLLLSPLLLAVALAIRLDSPGPVIFRQTRIGLNKRPFTLLKFRTMCVDAEARQAALEAANEVSGPVFKIRNDPRTTRLGAFLRRTSLDELPQLVNVLRNEMSLVGPRPLPLRDVAGFREDWQRRRFSVLPGVTCLWQLSGRSNISFERWMELDLEYIDRWSLRLDFSILLRTVPAVLRRSGAY